MKTYQDLLRKALKDGTATLDRTGVGTLALYGEQLRFGGEPGIPIVTTKAVHLKSVIAELLWFISGDTNARTLQEQGVTIWDEWAAPDGSLGPIYGKQWRDWAGTDQLANVIESIRTEPNSRRMLVNSWNVGHLSRMALPPCHMFYQFHVDNGRLHCQVYMRSADIFLGLPFNIASYAILLRMVAYVTDLRAGDLIMTLGDAHLYRSHIQQAHTQLQRSPLPRPRMTFAPDTPKDIDLIRAEHIVITGYNPYPAIKAPVAV